MRTSASDHAGQPAHEVPDSELRGVARVLLVCNAFGLAVTLVGMPLGLGWVSATLATGFGLLVLSAWIVRRGLPRWSVNLWLFGLCAGVVELLADHWLVMELRVLVYDPGGPFVLASPAYMPLAWGGMLEAGVVAGLLLRRRVGLGLACALVGVGMGLYLPLYEHLAYACGWWWYRDTAMFLGTVPWFIALGEVLVGAPLPWLGARLAQLRPGAAAGLGAAVGAWIGLAYAAAWVLVG
jgi:hypothetical protein